MHLQVPMHLVNSSTAGFKHSLLTSGRNPTDIALSDYKEKKVQFRIFRLFIRLQLFSFADSSAATFKDFKNQSAVLASTSTNIDPVVKPSPYNMSFIYPQVVDFDKQVTFLLSTAK